MWTLCWELWVWKIPCVWATCWWLWDFVKNFPVWGINVSHVLGDSEIWRQTLLCGPCAGDFEILRKISLCVGLVLETLRFYKNFPCVWVCENYPCVERRSDEKKKTLHIDSKFTFTKSVIYQPRNVFRKDSIPRKSPNIALNNSNVTLKKIKSVLQIFKYFRKYSHNGWLVRTVFGETVRPLVREGSTSHFFEYVVYWKNKSYWLNCFRNLFFGHWSPFDHLSVFTKLGLVEHLQRKLAFRSAKCKRDVVIIFYFQHFSHYFKRKSLFSEGKYR